MNLKTIRTAALLLPAACGFAIGQSATKRSGATPGANAPQGSQQQQQQQQRQQPAQPPEPAPDPAEAYHRSGGSLLRAALSTQANANQAPLESVSFFAVPEPEPRVVRKHDLVTIIVREESSFSSDGSTDFKKEAEFDARVEEFLRLNALFRDLQVRGGGASDPIPSINASGSREFKGEGTVDRTDKLTLRVTAEVVDVKPNGTLVLQARQRIKTDEEEQIFVLSGVCRAADLSADNTVLSTQMFDKELTKTHKGVVRQATRRGWLSKLLDVVSPF